MGTDGEEGLSHVPVPRNPRSRRLRHSQLGPQHREEALGAQRIEWTSLHLPAGIWLSHIDILAKKNFFRKKTSSDVFLVGW